MDRSGTTERSYGMNWLEGFEAKDVNNIKLTWCGWEIPVL